MKIISNIGKIQTMELSSVARWLTKRIKIDPEGVEGEVESAKKTNADFWNYMHEIGEGIYFNLQSEEIFEVTVHDGKTRVTRKLSPDEIKKINTEWPPANE